MSQPRRQPPVRCDTLQFSHGRHPRLGLGPPLRPQARSGGPLRFRPLLAPDPRQPGRSRRQRHPLSAAIELRRLFPGITNNRQARECARVIAGWLAALLERSADRGGFRFGDDEHALFTTP
jgi:hypothetical protein